MGGPGYSRRGAVEVGFASQRHYIGLYILRQDALPLSGPRLSSRVVGLKIPPRIIFDIHNYREYYSYDKLYINEVFCMRTVQMTLDDDLVNAVDGVVKRLRTTRSQFT